MEMPASRTSASCSSWRSMALSLLRRFRRAPRSPNAYRYNPESTGVGILSAVMAPSARRQRILGPLVHSGARDILEVALPSVCCSHGRPLPFRATILSCGFCCSWIGGGAVYMYKGEIGFCKPECRDDYITEELYRPKGVRSEDAREKVPTMVDGMKGDRSSIFFTCADSII